VASLFQRSVTPTGAPSSVLLDSALNLPSNPRNCLASNNFPRVTKVPIPDASRERPIDLGTLARSYVLA